MNIYRESEIRLAIVVGLVGIPVLLHTLFTGAHVISKQGGVMWIGPISTTIPFAFLAIFFLAHCERLLRKQPSSNDPHRLRSAYVGVATAWLAMMALTVFVICHPLLQRVSSTMGIAVLVTPFFYLPFLFFPYVIGAILCRFCGGGNVPKPNLRVQFSLKKLLTAMLIFALSFSCFPLMAVHPFGLLLWIPALFLMGAGFGTLVDRKVDFGILFCFGAIATAVLGFLARVWL